MRSPALLTSGVDAVAALTALANKKGDTVLRGLVGGGGRRPADVPAGGPPPDGLALKEAEGSPHAVGATASSPSSVPASPAAVASMAAVTAEAAAATPRRRAPSAVRGAARPLRRMLSRRLSNASSASAA